MQQLIDTLAQNLSVEPRLVTLALLLLGGVFTHLVLGAFVRRLHRVARASAQNWDDVFVTALETPVRVVLWVLIAHLALQIYPLAPRLHQQLTQAYDTALVLLLAWFLNRLVIGIAVGFAAKDLLANFFGGLSIYLDRPFTTGDWIRSPDRQVEGTVEDIGWRLTRIRTFDQRPLYVPNAVFSQIAVENPSRMFNRRIYETIGIRYQDASKMGQVVAQVKEMLENHPAIDRSRTLIVNFVSFGPSSLDFFVYTFTRTTVWVEFHEIKQDILLQILDIIHANGADVAFPTRTLHLEQCPPEPAQ